MFVPPDKIETERLWLRPFTPADLDELHDVRSRPEVHTYLYGTVLSRDALKAKLDERIAKMSRLTQPGDSLLLAVVRKDSGVLIGDVNIEWKPGEHQQAEIGYVLHPDHYGNGFATEASRPLLRIAFDELKVHRVVGRLDARNDASGRVLAKLGMRREGLMVENEYVKGEWTSEIVYAILDREWAAQAA